MISPHLSLALLACRHTPNEISPRTFYRTFVQ